MPEMAPGREAQLLAALAAARHERDEAARALQDAWAAAASDATRLCGRFLAEARDKLRRDAQKWREWADTLPADGPDVPKLRVRIRALEYAIELFPVEP